MFEPCYEHCWLRYGKSYSEECNQKCSYAKAVLEKKHLEEKLEKIYTYVQRQEDLWLERVTGTDFEKDNEYSIRAIQYQKVRYYIEELEEGLL